MKKFIIGKKIEMSQVFDKNGLLTTVTAVSVKPLNVSQIKSEKIDGYSAVQLSLKDGKKEIKKEFRLDDIKLNKGDSVELSQFNLGDNITVSAISKGKGFQGVVKRHGFGGGPRSHGQKHSEREPGSIGGGLRNKVPKKMRMAGRMGGDRITVKNLKVVNVDLTSNILYISGAIPGRRGTVIEIVG